MNEDMAAGEGKELSQRKTPKPAMLIALDYVSNLIPPLHTTLELSPSLPLVLVNWAQESPLLGSPPFCSSPGNPCGPQAPCLPPAHQHTVVWTVSAFCLPWVLSSWERGVIDSVIYLGVLLA